MSLTLTDSGTSREVRTPDWKIHYNEAGEGHPVILLHGSGPGATGWSNFGPNMAHLAERYRVLAVDMPGWGRSDAATTPKARDHVEAALQFMNELGLERAAFIGNSMGGMTSLRFAATHPDRISHLITMGSGAPGVKMFGPGDGPTEGLKVLAEGYHDPSPATLRRLVEIMTFDSSFVTDELIEQRSAAARNRPDHLAAWIAAQAGPRTFLTEQQIAGITAPTLLFHGRDDRVVHFENSLKLVSLIPNSRLVLLNRCGHWAQLEHAQEFNRVVDDFIAAN